MQADVTLGQIVALTQALVSNLQLESIIYWTLVDAHGQPIFYYMDFNLATVLEH